MNMKTKISKPPTQQKPNPKGPTPTRAMRSDNLNSAPAGDKVGFQLKIAPALKREVKAYAATRDLKSSVLFAQMWELFKEKHKIST